MSNQSRWCNHAFGLAIDSSFAFAGFPGEARSVRRGLPQLSLGLASEESLREPFAQDSTAIGWRRDSDGQALAADVLSHPTAGFLLDAPVGTFKLAADGRQLRCAPRDELEWRWQRYVLGRVLPFAATLRGLEPWHASAVTGPAGAIALMGDPGIGKTTIAAELMLAGADLVADDVISVALSDGRPVAHPGPPLMSVWSAGFTPTELEQLGSAVARVKGSLRLAVRRASEPVSLRAVYLLTRDRHPSRGFGPLATPDRLIGATFNFALRTPERLSRQLELASAIWRHTQLVEVRVTAGADLRALARAIHRDASDRLDRNVVPD